MPSEADDSKDPFDGVLAVKRTIAFKALGVGKTLGHELIKDGTLEVADLGPRSKPVTVESIRRALRNGITKAAQRNTAAGP
jgi:hypothetical protein